MGEQQGVQVAVVDEAACIGCTLCRRVCPTDAFVGSAKMVHTVLEEDCTGCGTCLPVCPVGCIDLKGMGLLVPRKRQVVMQPQVTATMAMPVAGDLQAKIVAAREKARARHAHLAGKKLGVGETGV